MLENVEHGDTDASYHSGNGARPIQAFEEYSHHQGGKDRGGGETKGDGHGTGGEIGRVQSKITGYGYGSGHGDAPCFQFVFFRDIGFENAFQQVMGNSGGYGEQQASGGGKGGRESSRHDQRHHPVGKCGNLGVGQDHDVFVRTTFGILFRFSKRNVLEFVAFPSIAFGRGGKLFILVVVVLNAPVFVLVVVTKEAGGFPFLEPLGAIFVQQVAILCAHFAGLYGFRKVETSHRGDRGGGGVEYGDEDQGPTGGGAGILDLGYGEEAYDHVRKTCRSDHQ